MRSLLVLSAVLSTAALAGAAAAQQPKPVAPPVVAQPLKPVPLPAPAAKTATTAKSASRKYPVAITTPMLQLAFSTKPRAAVAFKPHAITTPILQLAVAKPGAAGPVAPFTPRTIRTDSLRLTIAPHP